MAKHYKNYNNWAIYFLVFPKFSIERKCDRFHFNQNKRSQL
ncbi:hypothetical protein [Nostoc sp.]